MNKVSRGILIVGYGQDGKILHRQALLKKTKVHIILKKKIKILSKNSHVTKLDIKNKREVFKYLKKQNKLDIYFFATHNISSSQKPNKKIFSENINSNIVGLTNFLDFMSKFKKKKFKLFYACSSHIFENSKNFPQDENSAPSFFSEYAFVKYMGLKICEHYREKNQVFCNVGILYTHVSKYTKKNFLIKELAHKVLKAVRNNKNDILVKNLNSKLDIMLAKDATNAMIKLMQLKKSNTFIISTGKLRSIKEIFQSIVKFYKIKKKIKLRSIEKSPKKNFSLAGNNKRLLKHIRWKPTYNLSYIVKDVLG